MGTGTLTAVRPGEYVCKHTRNRVTVVGTARCHDDAAAYRVVYYTTAKPADFVYCRVSAFMVGFVPIAD